MSLFGIFNRRRRARGRKPRAGQARRRLEIETLEGRIVPVMPGGLDPTFGMGGVATLSFNQPGGFREDVAADVAVQADGRLVVVGTTHIGVNIDIAVARFNPDGTPDTSFDGDGRKSLGILLPGAAANDVAEAVAVDAQGRIVVAGTVTLGGGNRDFAIIRLNPDGQLDSTFGNNGWAFVAFDLGGLDDAAHGLAIDHLGRIIVAGEVSRGGSNYDFGVARLTTSGQLDTTFNGTGKATVAFDLGTIEYTDSPFGPPIPHFPSRYDAAADVALDSQGRIVVAGSATRRQGNNDFAVARLTASGQLDTSFGNFLSPGRMTYALEHGGANNDVARALALDSMGRIIVAGTASASVGEDFAVIRVTATGALDTAFGSSGKQFVDCGSSGYDQAHDVAVDDQGRVVLAGTFRSPGGREDFAAARLTTSGALDNTFGAILARGRIVHPLNRGDTNWDAAGAVAIDREGRLVLAGGADLGSHTDFTLARLDGGDSIRIVDASGDSTPGNVFQGGAVRVSFHFAQPAAAVDRIWIEATAWPSGTVTTLLEHTYAQNPKETHLEDRRNVPLLAAGSYNVRVRARLTNGQTTYSAPTPLFVQARTATAGTFQGEPFTLSSSTTAAVFAGSGGTDTLDLGVAGSSIATVNGMSWAEFMATRSTYRQAVYQGSAFDYVRLNDGREVYFQGIERLRLAGGEVFELALHPDDPQFANQWNLHVSDVPGAWRFSTGTNNVLLVSLDTGILTAAGGMGGINDIATARLLTDATDDDNNKNYGHGHSAISVMASTANNASGVAGINWGSPVMVADVYSGTTLQRAIRNGVTRARENGQRVVFQGGIQGEAWLAHGGTQAQLEALVRDNADIAVFAIAAGNGGPGGEPFVDPNYLTSVSGVAKLETNHGNVIAVGALKVTGETVVNGLTNASTVGLASYSNRGANLTLVAPTDSKAVDKLGTVRTFGGTSCANPNLAAMTSLVWSVNPTLTGSEVRQVLLDTAMDLGTAGRDETYGHGLVNAEAAVRRASALARDGEVARLVPNGPFWFRLPTMPFNPTTPTPPPSPPATAAVVGWAESSRPTRADDLFVGLADSAHPTVPSGVNTFVSSVAAALVRGPAHGSLTFSAAGRFTYVPPPDLLGTDPFIARATDGLADSAEAVVTWTLTLGDEEGEHGDLDLGDKTRPFTAGEF